MCTHKYINSTLHQFIDLCPPENLEDWLRPS